MAVRIHLRLASLIRGAVNMWLVHLAASIRATACLDLHFRNKARWTSICQTLLYQPTTSEGAKSHVLPDSAGAWQGLHLETGKITGSENGVADCYKVDA